MTPGRTLGEAAGSLRPALSSAAGGDCKALCDSAGSQSRGIAGAGRDLWRSFRPRQGHLGQVTQERVLVGLSRERDSATPRGQLLQSPASLSVKFFLICVLVYGSSMDVTSFVSLGDNY